MSDSTGQTVEQSTLEQSSKKLSGQLEEVNGEQKTNRKDNFDSTNSNPENGLDKVREEGKLRADNIREIVRDAVSQAVSELKAGSGEIGQIVKNAIFATVADLRSRKRQDPQEITASIEGAIEGSTYQKRQEIAQHRARLQELQAQIDEQQRLLDREVEGALIDVDADSPDDEIKLAVSQAVSSAKESQVSANLKQQYLKLKTQLEGVDRNLLSRYGDRYTEVKQQWESAKVNAKTWYDHNKAEAEAKGTPALQQKQVEVEHDLADFAVTVAHKEQEIKEQLIKKVRSFLNK
jgi:hypothetical protein